MPKKHTVVGIPFSIATCATFAAGSIPSTGNAPRDEVLQQVPVVARNLHYPAVHTEPKPFAHLVDVAARVFDPARRIRREVRILGEDLVWSDEFLQLHQETRIAHIRMQRIERLHLLQLIGRDVRLAQGRHPEVDEGGLQWGTAEAAAETGPGRQEWNSVIGVDVADYAAGSGDLATGIVGTARAT